MHVDRHVRDAVQHRPVVRLHVTASRAALRNGTPDQTSAGGASAPDGLEHAIEQLPDRERLALVLHHRAGLSTREMGAALGCSPEQAASTLREAYRRLGVERDDDDGIPEVELDAP